MASGNAWPFFLFLLDRLEVGSESEPEKSYRSSWAIGILLFCICRIASSHWSSVSLASSSVIFELACTNFSFSFWQWSCSAEALFSTILTLSVRLLWQLLYYLTFLSDSEDASSSIWQTMFGHAIQKAFSTSLGGISTVSAFDTSMTCEAYTSHMSHPSWCVVVMKWGILWMSQVLDLSPASKIFTSPCSGTSFHLYPSLDPFLSNNNCSLIFLYLGILCSWFVKTPDDYYLITLCWISSVVWHMLSEHISRYVTVCDLSINACSCHDKFWGTLAPCSSRYISRASRSLQELNSSHVTSPTIHLTCNSKSLLVHFVTTWYEFTLSGSLKLKLFD